MGKSIIFWLGLILISSELIAATSTNDFGRAIPGEVTTGSNTNIPVSCYAPGNGTIAREYTCKNPDIDKVRKNHVAQVYPGSCMFDTDGEWKIGTLVYHPTGNATYTKGFSLVNGIPCTYGISVLEIFTEEQAFLGPTFFSVFNYCMSKKENLDKSTENMSAAEIKELRTAITNAAVDCNKHNRDSREWNILSTGGSFWQKVEDANLTPSVCFLGENASGSKTPVDCVQEPGKKGFCEPYYFGDTPKAANNYWVGKWWVYYKKDNWQGRTVCQGGVEVLDADKAAELYGDNGYERSVTTDVAGDFDLTKGTSDPKIADIICKGNDNCVPKVVGCMTKTSEENGGKGEVWAQCHNNNGCQENEKCNNVTVQYISGADKAGNNKYSNTTPNYFQLGKDSCFHIKAGETVLAGRVTKVKNSAGQFEYPENQVTMAENHWYFLEVKGGSWKYNNFKKGGSLVRECKSIKISGVNKVSNEGKEDGDVNDTSENLAGGGVSYSDSNNTQVSSNDIETLKNGSFDLNLGGNTFFNIHSKDPASPSGYSILTLNNSNCSGIGTADIPAGTCESIASAGVGFAVDAKSIFVKDTYFNANIKVAQDSIFSGKIEGGIIKGTDFTGNTFTATSDRRLKTDLKDFSNPLDKILRLKGMNYRFKVNEYLDRNLPEGVQSGLIAQDTAKVIPEVVQQDEDGFYSVNYLAIVPYLIEGIKALHHDVMAKLQSQDAKTKTLETRIDKLEKENKDLKQRVEKLEGKK